jgi:hypothetical protein
MKLLYPEEERPLRHVPELSGRLTAGVERLAPAGHSLPGGPGGA